MVDILLTKSTDKVLCKLYKEYLVHIKNNIPKSTALIFSVENINNIFQNQNIDFELSELKSKSLIDSWITGEILLTSDAIIYMENRFKNNVTELTDFISKFLP